MLLNVQNAMIRQNNRTPDRKVGSSLLVVEYLTSDIKHQTSNVKHQTSNVKHQTSNIKRQTSNIKHQTSNIKRQTSNIIHQMPSEALIAGTRASASAVQRS